jgi:hypothetical protein
MIHSHTYKTKPIIWQYWETRNLKPYFIDGLFKLAKQNSGIEVIRVTPETLHHFLPDIPDDILRINVLAHKADMIRAMLVCKYGGMWLDSDAIVLKDLHCFFDYLLEYDFIGFNYSGRLTPCIKVCCFLARPECPIMKEWVQAQHSKLPRRKFKWSEIGRALLGPICVTHGSSIKVLPFNLVCPIPSKRSRRLYKRTLDADDIINSAFVVMMHNSGIKKRHPEILKMTIEDIAADNYLLSKILRFAISRRKHGKHIPENTNMTQPQNIY